METNILKYMAFVKTVECGSFTLAANQLNYSQSGVSHMIGDLEREWKVSLLKRDRSGVTLTSEGLILLPYAQRVCQEYQNLESRIGELNGLESGLIRIGTVSSVATHWLPPIIKEFQKDYPNIDYELLLGDYSEIETWILEGRVDYGFLRLPAHPELETTLLSEDRMLVVMSEDHPLAGCEKFPVSALEESPFMLLERSSKTDVSDLLERLDVKVNVHFTTWDDYAIMSMVESGLGISILPELILQRIPYRIVIKELEVPASRKICLAVKNEKNMSLAAKRFIQYLPYRDVAAGPPQKES